jgi:VWFA-related protein
VTSFRPGIAAALVWALATAAGASSDWSTRQEPQQPIFRSTASAVMVDVAVRDRNRRSINNLRAEEFDVLDNGVAQTVSSVSYGKLPIDVTVALDVSYSVTGLTLQRLRQAVQQLVRDLGRDDRLKLMLFNMRVHRTIDFTTDERVVEAALKNVSAGGSTALLDAVSVALVSSAPSDRRQLIVFFTDGSDSTSVTTPATLTIVARRSRATLTFVMPGSGNVTVTSSAGTVRTTISSTGFLVPSRPDSLWARLATETGGRVLPVGATSDLSATFRQVLEEFRSAYVLYYNARGVDTGGYHTLDVKVKREGATVQARRGYWY